MSGSSRIGLVCLLVRDYDEAIAFYVGSLGFEIVEDTVMDGGKRWVVVEPKGGQGAALLLARAATSAQQARIGDQTGGLVCFFLHTGDFDVEYERMMAAGVKFIESPRREAFGTVVVFEDLYGNKWDLIQPQI